MMNRLRNESECRSCLIESLIEKEMIKLLKVFNNESTSE